MGPTKDNLEYLFHSEGVDYHPQYTANNFEHGCHLLLRIGAIMITDPLVPLAIDPKLFALVPLKPFRMVQTSVYTPSLKPESRLVADFIACLRQEAASLEKRVAMLLGHSGTKAAARSTKRRT
jgi:DNA-binding transcriptional LysR family regulator